MSETELDIVRVLEDARVRATVEQDSETLERLVSDEMVYVHSSGMTDTKASFLEHLRNGPLQYRSIERRDTVSRLAGDDTAIFTGEASVKVEFDGHPLDLELRYLVVWARSEGTWRFEAWHSAPA